MSKNKSLNRWLWKWHIIAGLITAPLMIMLSVTGTIYLFKHDYEAVKFAEIQRVPIQQKKVSIEAQYKAVNAEKGPLVTQLILPEKEGEATRFISGMRRQKRTTYVNPYTGEVTGKVVAADTLMMAIRKFHGELLLGKGGTLFVELAASWFIVLILTGIYVWWPAKNFKLKGFFTIRMNEGKRIFYRDMHSVLGFWLSIFMLVILSGAMPWTDVFGSNLKWVQKQTRTGYPITWQKPVGLKSIQTESGNKAMTLDQMVKIARAEKLPGEITITLPKGELGVYTISNRSFWLSDQVVRHYDQYTGNLVKAHTWKDVGILMDARQVAMRLHQGEYGPANWWVLLIVANLFTISTIAGVVSYFIRRPKGSLGFPKIPVHWKVGQALVVIILGLAILFPMFGVSLVLIWGVEAMLTHQKGVESQ